MCASKPPVMKTPSPELHSRALQRQQGHHHHHASHNMHPPKQRVWVSAECAALSRERHEGLHERTIPGNPINAKQSPNKHVPTPGSQAHSFMATSLKREAIKLGCLLFRVQQPPSAVTGCSTAVAIPITPHTHTQTRCMNTISGEQ